MIIQGTKCKTLLDFFCF